MATNKFFKSLLFALTIAINVFGFSVQESSAYPVFAQQNYSNPRAANGKLACANCHLNQKAIEIEAPQAVLPNSVFEVEIKVPYDTSKQQIGANGKKADLNVGGILILPKGFKLAAKNQISEEVKLKNKGVFISPYSTEFDNIFVVGPIAGKTHQELLFPVVAPDPEKNPDIKYLTYPFYAGGNRGRGQVYPTGEKSNVNVFGASQGGNEITNGAAAVNNNSKIEIKDFAFNPPTITVKSGQQITWINRDDEPHTIVSVEKQFKKSPALDTDQQYTVTAGAPGTYSYFCSVHPKMTGTIVVEKQ